MNTLIYFAPILIVMLFGFFVLGCLLHFSQRKQAQIHLEQMLTLIEKTDIEHKEKQFLAFTQHNHQLHEQLTTFLQTTNEQYQQGLYRLQHAFNAQFSHIDEQLQKVLERTTQSLVQQFEKLNQSTQAQLLNISQAVEAKLTSGLDKTHQTFTQVIERLAMIDEAQKKMTALSQNVISLQEILSDKRSRGAFGEVQLNALIQNLLPNSNYSFQATLSNGTRVDCLLKLPEPTGHIAIDAKFPLENYRKFTDASASDAIKATARTQFKLDIKKHIQDISQKYILPPETSVGALMFIPAEAVFAEIHAHHPDLVEYAMHANIWMASPSTMMAILTTASSVIKDSARKEQMHVIQNHLRMLAQDFSRFEKRMDNLSKHIQQAHQDVDQVQTSAQKITKRFQKIEQVELPQLHDTLPQDDLAFEKTDTDF